MAQQSAEQTRIAELEAQLAALQAKQTAEYTVRLHKGAQIIGKGENAKPGPNRDKWYITAGTFRTSIGVTVVETGTPTKAQVANALEVLRDNVGKLADCTTGVTAESLILAQNAKRAAAPAPAAPVSNGVAVLS